MSEYIRPEKFILHKGHPRRKDVAANAIRRIRELAELDVSIELLIDRHVKTRTTKQRKALFGAAYKALMEFSGLQGDDEKRELHRFFCGEFFGWVTDGWGNKTPVRTTTKDEFGNRDEIKVPQALEFYEFLQRRGAEVGCIVPDPDPFWREMAKQEMAKEAA